MSSVPYAPWSNPDTAVTGASAYTKTFRIAPGGEATTEFELRRGHCLRGRFVTVEGTKPPVDHGVKLELWYSGDKPFGGDGFFGRYAVNGDAFEVDGLVPGKTYQVRVTGGEGVRRWRIVAMRGIRDGRVVVPLDEDPPPIEVLLGRTP